MCSERRQITVMFCDLVDSTRLSHQLDPEDYRDLLRTYQETVAEVIDNFDGYIAQHLGDGVLAYFGYPISHEENAHRAIISGLRILDGIKNLHINIDSRLKINISVRIGIHTGGVLIDEIGSLNKREHLALEAVPNIASRLQVLAKPNELIISSNTFEIISGLINYKFLGTHSLKGISEAQKVYIVLGEKKISNRFEPILARGLAPLVGRKEEKELLLEGYTKSNNGKGQVIMISGEAGIGKSHLLQEFKSDIPSHDFRLIENHCSVYYQNTTLYPVIDYLERYIFKNEVNDIKKYHKLNKTLDKFGFSPEAIELCANLLSIKKENKYAALKHLSPVRIREKTFEELVNWRIKESEEKTVVYIVEDLHWSDPSTLDYLNLLIKNIPKTRILLILTYRPDFISPWKTRRYITQISLNRLTKKNAEELILNTEGALDLSESVVQDIVYKSDGVPFFLEELTKLILNSEIAKDDAKPYQTLTSNVPGTLNDLLMAKLDRLNEGKKVAQLASVLGREFTFELISALSAFDQKYLKKYLANLVESEILYQRGVFPDAIYYFKHYLIQEVAYQSLLKTDRKSYHEKIVSLLQEKFINISESHPELLAHHYTESGQIDNGIKYWIKAGKKAIQNSANLEAINHLQKALDLLSNLKSEDFESKHLELEILTTMGGPLRVTKGFASNEVEEIYERAFQISKNLGSNPELFPILRGMCGFYLAKSKFKTAKELARKCLDLGKALDDSSYIMQAHYLHGAVSFCTGNITLAEKHSSLGISIYDPKKHSSHTYAYGQDPGVACLYWNAWALWFLGYPDKAIQKANEALKLAESISHSYSLSIALVLLAFLHQYRIEPLLAQRYAAKSQEISKEEGSEFFIEMATILEGWAYVEQNNIEKGIQKINGGISDWLKTGSELYIPYWLGLLAHAYLKEGNINKASENINKAIDKAEKNGEIYYLAELFRIKGELLLKINCKNTDKAQKHLMKSIQIARKQKSKSLELKAILSLSKLLVSMNNESKAIKMLNKIYGSFSEGFDTKDLIDAKEMVEQIS